MKTRTILMVCGVWMALGLVARAQNNCIEGGPYTNYVSCYTQGTWQPGGALSPSSITVGAGQPIPQPTAINLSVTGGSEIYYVSYDCSPQLDGWYTSPIGYTYGKVQFTPAFPQILWNPGTYYYTGIVVATGSPCGPLTNNLGVVTLTVTTNDPDVFIDADFGGLPASAKMGYAAAGTSTSDFWNEYNKTNVVSGSLPDLLTVQKIASPVGLLAADLPWLGRNGSTDPMYNDYLSTNNGVTAMLTVTNLPTGNYAIYLYSDDGNFDLQVQDGSGTLIEDFGTLSCFDLPLSTPLVWQQGKQYVAYGDIPVTNGQRLVVQVGPGLEGAALVSGMQIMAAAPTPPYIIMQPASCQAWPGDNETFSVLAGGTPPLAYQWTFNGNNIPNATNAFYVVTNVQPAQTGTYAVEVTNPYGSVTSSNALLTIDSATCVPIIYSFNPILGYPGTNVTLIGTNFSSITSNNIVYFGAVRASVVSASVTNLIVTVPAGATFGPITVTVSRLTGYADQPFLPTFPGTGGNLSASDFATRLDLPVGSGPGQVVVADMDGDGKPDLVIGDAYSGDIYIYRNIGTNNMPLGSGSFAPPVVLTMIKGNYANPQTILVSDLDGDGRPDIIAFNSDSKLISIYRNISSPGSLSTSSFATRQDIPVQTALRNAAIQDINGDGKPDIITVNGNNPGIVSIFQNISTNGTISFAAPVNLAADAQPDSIAIGDMDGDGQPDLVVGTFNGLISIYRNLGATNNVITTNEFAARVDFSCPVQVNGIVLGDVDGDGKLDILAADGDYSDMASVFLNTSTLGQGITTNSFAPVVNFSLDGWGNNLTVGDLNGDGKFDVAVVTQIGNELSLFQNESTVGSFGSQSLGGMINLSTGSNPNGVAIGDLNGDGRPDIIFANQYSGSISIYENMTPAAPIIISEPTNQIVVQGGTATFTVAAGGASPLSYQWYFNNTILPGQTKATLTISDVGTANAGAYSVVVSSPEGSASSSSATLTVEAVAPLTVYAGPNQTITNQTSAIQFASTQLQGVITGSGYSGGDYIATWSVMSGPPNAAVVFANDNLTNTIVTFTNNNASASGTYDLRLTATTSDGQWVGSSDVFIRVESALDPIYYDADGYRYVYTPEPSYPDFFETNYYDCDCVWKTGSACFGNDGCGPGTVTYWPGSDNGYPYLYLRKHFYIPPGTTNLDIGCAIDNEAEVFLNGYLVTPILTTNEITGDIVQPNIGEVTGNGGDVFNYIYEGNITNHFDHQGCSGDDDVILNNISPTIWHTNDNLLAVAAHDDGVASVFDCRVTLTVTNVPVNHPPLVYAGPNQYIPTPGSASLNGYVADDGLPGNGLANAYWQWYSGPDNNVQFSPQITPFTVFAPVNSYATFDAAGTYELQLIAFDGALFSTSMVTVVVGNGVVSGPVVNFVAPGPTANEGTIPITVTATPASGSTIENVQFYANNNLIGQSTGPSYTMNWIQVPVGNYTLTAVATDSAGRTGSASEGVNVINPVQPQNDSYTTFENMATNLNVLANDIDLSGGTLTIASVTQGANGTVTINANGTVTYTPLRNFTGGDSFTYTATDGTWSGTATVNINVINPIQVQNYNGTSFEFTPTNLNVLANDSDQNQNGTLRIISVTPGNYGSVTVDANGDLTYTPESMNLSLMSPPKTGFSAGSVNNNGVACGDISLPNNVTHAAIWQIGGGITDLDPDGTYSIAECINNNGDAVGYRQVTGGGYHAFEYINGQMIDLQNEVAQAVGADDIYTIAWGINDSGQICGQAYNSSGVNEGFFIDVNNQVTVLNSFGGTFMAAYGINNSAFVAGTSSTSDAFQAFDWQPGDSAPDDLSSYFTIPNQFVNAVNDNNDICGYTALYYNSWAFAITNGVFADLSSGYWNSWAFGMNYQEQIVGSWDSPQTEYKDRALYWLGSQHYDLNTLLPTGSPWLLTDAVSINENGLIVGIGSYQGNSTSFATYAPTAPYLGGDSFTYVVTDGTWTNTATVNINVISPVQAQNLGQTSYQGMATNLNVLVLANDSDLSGGTLTISSVTQGANGTVTLNANGTVTYTPSNPNYTGGDSFNYVASDGTWSNTATVYMNIIDPIYAGYEYLSTYGGTPVEVNVLQDDYDQSGGTLTIAAVTQGADGSVTFDGSGNVTYTPNPNFVGNDSFTYTVSDGTWSATATVYVTVNNPIQTQNYNGTSFEFMPTNLIVLTLDSDEDQNGQPLTIVSVTPGQHGSVTVGANGQLIYTPQNMQLSPMSPPSLPAGEQFSVKSVNINGVACGSLSLPNNITHAAVWQIGGPVTDLDPNGTYSIAESINDNGTVVGYRQISAGGAYHAFEYNLGGLGQITDLHSEVAGAGDPDSVASGINNNSQVCGQIYNSSSVYQGFFLDQNNNNQLTTFDTLGGSFINASGIDNRPLIVGTSETSGGLYHAFDWQQGDSGPVDLSSEFTAQNQYVNGVNNNGNGDICGYTVNNANDLAYAITNGVFDDLSPGYLNSMAYALNSQQQIVGAGAAQSGSPNSALYWKAGQSYNLNTLLPSGSGWVLNDAYAINENGLIVGTGSYQGSGTSFATYAPTTPYTGGDSFTYTVTDGTWTNTATVSINVIDPISANNYSMTIYGNAPMEINVVNNDSDQSGGTLTITSVTQGANGSVTFDSSGNVTYTPTTPGFSGNDTFTYTVSDGTWSATGTVYVSVTANPVEAVNLNAQVLGTLATVVPVMYNSSDQDGRQLSIQAVSQGANGGQVTIDSDGQTVSYTPRANPTTSDSFTYTLGDGEFSATATVTVNVTQVPLPPVVFNSPGFGTVPTTVSLSVPGYPNAVINYQINGGSWQDYSSPLSITSDSIITAYATQAGFTSSGLSSQEFGNPVAPVATPDFVTANQGDNVLNVLQNDIDSEGLGLLIVDTPVEPQNGTATIESDGTLHYQPNSGFYGIDSFSYTVQGYSGYESTATVVVFVNKQNNNSPSAADDLAILPEYTDVTNLDLLASDSDPDGDSLTVYAISSPPPMGSVINSGNQGAYVRQPTQFGEDTFVYIMTDGNGGYATANATVDQEDSQQLGVSDEWQDYYFGSVGVIDPTALAVNNIPNMADYELQADPTAAANPLDMSSISVSSQLAGVVTIPLGISPGVDDQTHFALLLDGQQAPDSIVQKVNGNWVAEWDTTTTPNGSHALSLDYTCEGLPVSDVYGDSLTVNVDNPLTFTNDIVGDELLVNATVNNGATSYSINVYDAATYDLLTTLSGDVVNGQIETSWGLTNEAGDIISTGPILCVFSLSNGQNSDMAAMAQPGGDQGGSPGPAKDFPAFHLSMGSKSFAVAWGFDQGPQPNEYGVGMDKHAVSILGQLSSQSPIYSILPQAASGNGNYPGSDHSFQFTKSDPGSKATLLQALKSSQYFLWVGHGGQDVLTPDNSASSPKPAVSSDDIASALGNQGGPVGPNKSYNHAYSLVILVGCNAYSSDFASAFGFPYFVKARTRSGTPIPYVEQPYYLQQGRSLDSMTSYLGKGLNPQAYVGWPIVFFGAWAGSTPGKGGYTDLCPQELSNIGQLCNDWMNGHSISTCIQNFGDNESAMCLQNNSEQSGDMPDGIYNDEEWELSGCNDLNINAIMPYQ